LISEQDLAVKLQIWIAGPAVGMVLACLSTGPAVHATAPRAAERQRSVYSEPQSNGGSAPERSVLDGVFAETQSKRGAAVYADACANCHAPTLGGKDVVPPLAGPDFIGHWNGSTVGDLFERIRTSMPPGRPGTLSPQQYTDVLAYILDKNSFPAASEELERDQAVLGTIRIETSKKP
jgi:mono/diheme cytochrome c family protein